MATFTITTPQNIDELASKAGNDVYNVNGGYLTIDQHSRYGLNQTTSAALGNITLSATLGGTCHIDGRYIRLIPFNGGSGTLPALNSLVTKGSASGKLVGVYSSLTTAPVVSGAIPASGWIMIKQWNQTEYTSGALTLSGITANCTGPSIVGWLEIVGVDASAITVSRLNLFKITGEYFDLGTTSGTNTTTYQIPTNGSTVFYLPGVQVETGAGTGVYEWYPCAGSRTALAANVATDEHRGKVCWIGTTGLLRFQHDGTNNTGGYLPPSGRKIRIPNVFLMTCTTTTTVNVIPNATLATRIEFVTTGGGVLDIDKASCNWYLNLSQAYSLSLTNTSIMSALSITELAAPITWSNCCIGQEAGVTQNSLTFSNNYAGGTVSDIYVTRALIGASGNYICTMADIDGFIFNNLKIHTLTPRGHATSGCVNGNRINNTTFNSPILIGGKFLGSTINNVKFNNTKYHDNPVGVCNVTYAHSAYEIITSSTDVLVDGMEIPIPLNVPFGALVALASASRNVKIRNIGTYNAPLNLGGAQQNCTWTRSSTTCTVTTPVAHNMVTGMAIYLLIMSDTSVAALGGKSSITVTGATTFTFTCTNAGASSGTLTMYPALSTYPLNVASSSALNNIKMQRVYCTHARTGLTSVDNTNKNMLFESCGGDLCTSFAISALNVTCKNISNTIGYAASTAIYGQHWADNFTEGNPPTLTNISWTRSTTTATVTLAGHNLRSGAYVLVTESSSLSAIPLNVYSITCVDADTFRFTCLNAGPTSGTISILPANGRVGIFMNEATTETTGQYLIEAGNPIFTSAGSVMFTATNDQITWISPHYIKAHSKFIVAQPVMVGGGTINNFNIWYAIDTGSGYGIWRNFYYGRTGAAGNSGEYTITIADTVTVDVGDYVWGTGIAPGAKVVSVDDSTTLTLDLANTATVSGNIVLNHLPSEVVNPSVGFKLKIRIRSKAAVTTGVSNLYVYTYSSDSDRAAQYPLDTNTLTLTNLPTGCDVVVLQAGTTTILDQQDSLAGTSYPYAFSGAQNVDIGIIKPGYVPYYIRNLALTTTDSSLPIALREDRNYI